MATNPNKLFLTLMGLLPSYQWGLADQRVSGSCQGTITDITAKYPVDLEFTIAVGIASSSTSPFAFLQACSSKSMHPSWLYRNLNSINGTRTRGGSIISVLRQGLLARSGSYMSASSTLQPRNHQVWLNSPWLMLQLLVFTGLLWYGLWILGSPST